MKLKCRPQDFVVRERIDWEPVPRGRYGIYRLSKSKLSTFDALRALSKTARVPLAEIGYAGLKDRQACATQLISIPGPRRAIESTEIQLAYLGRARTPISRASLRGNDFALVVRDLSRRDVARLNEQVKDIRAFGVPNYFDNQRFECMLSRRRLVGRALVLGRYEEALHWFLVGEPGRRGGEHDTARYLRRHWGEWARCAARFSRRRTAPLFRHLAHYPDDFAGAFALVNPDLFLLHLYAFQSWIWNEALADVITELVPAEQRFALPYAAGEHVFYRRLPSASEQALRAMVLPLPDHATSPAEPLARQALERAFARVGLRQEDFRLRWPAAPPDCAAPRPSWEFRQQDRPLLVTPENLWLSAPRRDRLHPGRLAVRLRFQLPAGAYATLVVKRLAENAAVFDRRPRGDRVEPAATD